MTGTPPSSIPDTAALTGRRRRLLRRCGIVLVAGWAAVATSILALDTLGAAGTGPQAAATTATQAQLAELVAQRDARAAEAASAQTRFTAALDQLSAMQTQLLASEEKRRELESGIGAIQASLHDALARNAETDRRLAAAGTLGTADPDGDMSVALDILSGELESIAARSAEADQRAIEAVRTAEALEVERDEILRRNEEIFAQLEAAVEQSVKPLDDMMKKVGVDSDRLLATVRKGYEGTGGPLTPMGYSTRGNAAITENEARAQEVMVSLGNFNNYRIAVSKLPLAMPVKSAFRFSSGFGARWGRQHQGVDLAAPTGTSVFATGDGVVTFAGWQRGYGNLIKIQHELGTETRYGHLSKIRVKAGQKVSRNTLIGDIGNTGRSTGPHLHYEVRVDGKAVDPMSFIKAAQNVF
ncbi:Murein DD-endopeptidase MepM and murein hydrolase activator NlpD, contain LysM domain [Paracoccus alkenifer]|uniref:Murein DD-endopeptidase MepM and murein hydrolase activator NlpD, contain LysM domain n=2 Tax=Paracoccus alkenifer TaxID=65735 RepID=A0A1H6K6U5_9RHOB|nr:Murein DD-endopeptidase MepM and murein hydrolase activator NlpD, contain LysM domain [Paracoccus alkenifer]